MLKKLNRSILAAGLLALGVVPVSSAVECPALLNHTFPALQNGKPMLLCQYAGKVILVVNTASFCGFTTQYDGLENKYLINRDGTQVVAYTSFTKPEDKDLLKKIDEFLKKNARANPKEPTS